MIRLIILLGPFLFIQTGRKKGNPLEHLPPNVHVITEFGERADFSPDNKHIAFMAKSFGDAMLYDLDTKSIRCLTCVVPGAAFLRVMHLSNGDYILIGPDHFENIRVSRSRDSELWYLRKEKGSKPTKLNQKLSEGAAISKNTLTMAFTYTPDQDPGMDQSHSQLILVDIDTASSPPKLVNRRVAFESHDRNCRLEAQDFYDNNTKLTVTCYEPGAGATTQGVDIKTGTLTDMSKHPGYSEVEGIFPGGQYTLVESDRQCETLGGTRGSGNIDIWKLRLDGTGKDFTRLTFFNDYEGGKASNPVVSTDGKFMAFQTANTSDAAGVGYGILLWEFK